MFLPPMVTQMAKTADTYIWSTLIFNSLKLPTKKNLKSFVSNRNEREDINQVTIW